MKRQCLPFSQRVVTAYFLFLLLLLGNIGLRKFDLSVNNAPLASRVTYMRKLHAPIVLIFIFSQILASPSAAHLNTLSQNRL